MRLLLAGWITIVLFFCSLQEGLYKRVGDGVVGQQLRDLNAWVCRFTSPKTTFEPER